MEVDLVNETLSQGIVNIFRGLTRPVCTFLGLFGITMMVWNDIDVPGYYIGFVALMLGTWFGERAINRLRGK